jgi:hypothetical protein
MPLVGELRDFALHDFLYLVARGLKTGSLVLHRTDAAATLFFEKGKLVSVVRPQPRERLGAMLIRVGKISQPQLDEALAVQGVGDMRPIGEILVELGHITKDDWQSSVQAVIEDTVYDLFTWHEGEFEFRAGEPPPVDEIQTPVPIVVENLIMEGVRRVDELTRIKERIPNTDMIVCLTERADEPEGEVNLTADEWRVFVRVDDRASIAALATRLNQSLFQVSSTVFGLIVYGLVEVMPAGTTTA